MGGLRLLIDAPVNSSIVTEILVARGVGTGPTESAAYDAALADVGIEAYNLLRLSSVVPPGSPVRTVARIDLAGTPGDVLKVVEARAVATAPKTAVAGLGWAVSEAGPGLFHEASASRADASESEVAAAIEAGLEHGLELRSWSPVSEGRLLAKRSAPGAGHACAVVVAAMGTPTSP